LFSVENNGQAAVCEHREIADAIAEKDAQKAYKAMENHITNVIANIKNIAKKRG
jgi:DNA-binding GntR family transcriptional regulator